MPKLSGFAAAALLIVMSTACGTTDAPGPLEPSGPVGRVRFVNLITDPARALVNVSLEGVPFAAGVAYTVSAPANLPAPSTAPYAAVLAGARTFVLKRTADTTSTVASLGFTAVASEDQTVYAVGGAGASAVTGHVTTDVNSAPASGSARMRVVQMSPTAGSVDIFITAVGADLATATPTITNLAYKAASSYFTLAPGTYQMRAVPTGTAAANRSANVTVNLGSFTVAAGNGRTIVTADNTTGGTPLRAFVLTDQ